MDKVERRKRAFFGRRFTLLLNNWQEVYGKTQKDFCQIAGVSKNIVTAWKHGERYPQDAQMMKICETLEVEESVFTPYASWEYDEIDYSVTASQSKNLQKYADEKGLDDAWYQAFIHTPGFLRHFPLHRYEEEDFIRLTSRYKDEFDLEKFEIEDDFGNRVMMNKEDIDFLVYLQNKTKNQVMLLMYAEKDKIKRKQIEIWIEKEAKPYKIDLAEVKKRVFAVDLNDPDVSITRDKVREVIEKIAFEKGIKPQYTIDDIVNSFPAMDRDTKEWIIGLLGRSQDSEMTDILLQTIFDNIEKERQKKIQDTVNKCRQLGYLIDDNTDGEG